MTDHTLYSDSLLRCLDQAYAATKLREVMHNCLVFQREKLKTPKKSMGRGRCNTCVSLCSDHVNVGLSIDLPSMYDLFLADAEPCSEH